MSNIDNIKNPKLRALADQCQHRSTGDFGMTIVGGVDLEAFAAAIVRECIAACERHDPHPDEYSDQREYTQRGTVRECVASIEKLYK